MRIAIVIHEFPPYGGGAATAAAQVAAELVRGGHHVLVVTSSVPGGCEGESEHGYEITRLPTTRRSRLAPRPHELLTYAASCFWRLERHLRKFQAEGVIAFMAVPSGYFAVRAAQRMRIPAVVSLRGSDVPGFSPDRISGLYRAVADRLVRSTLRRADAIAPNSEFLASLATGFCPDVASRMTIVFNGIEPAAIADQPACSDGTSLRLVQVGQLIARKQVQHVIEAIPRLLEANIPVRLTVIGSGPLENELRDLARRLCPADAVEFLGHLSRDRILTTLRCCDLFLSTSKAEGMSNAVLEAMASGLPIIIAPNGSEDIVKAARSGRVLQEVTSVEIAQQVTELYAQPTERRDLGLRGIEFARQHSWTATASSFVELLRATVRFSRSDDVPTDSDVLPNDRSAFSPGN